MTPEEAIGAARAAAAARPAEALPGFRVEPLDDVTPETLGEWAAIEPDTARVYSTRRLGAPITWLKRGLLRLLFQYHRELLAEQTRFNLLLTEQIVRLERRVRELEAERRR